MPLIEVIQPENAEGELKTIYDDLIQSRGKIAEVHKIQSLNPESIVRHMDLYMTLMYGKSPIKRVLREMIAVIVSKANECEYCQVHHMEAMDHYWKDKERSLQLMKDYHSVDLTEVEHAYCDYAWNLTKHPQNDMSPFVEKLKSLDQDDRAVLDATMIIGYFNFVNRIVASLKVELEVEGAGGYKFD